MARLRFSNTSLIANCTFLQTLTYFCASKRSVTYLTSPHLTSPYLTTPQVGVSELPAYQVVLAADEQRAMLTEKARVLEQMIDDDIEGDDDLSKQLEKVCRDVVVLFTQAHACSLGFLYFLYMYITIRIIIIIFIFIIIIILIRRHHFHKYFFARVCVVAGLQRPGCDWC